MTPDQILARRVVARLVEAKPYVKDKETKEHKADKLAEKIRDATGISKGMAENIADAIVRGREVLRLALQKSWPISEDGTIEGPKGTIDLSDLSMAKTAAVSDAAIKKDIVDAFEKPEDIEDPAEQIDAIKDISPQLQRLWKGLDREAEYMLAMAKKVGEAKGFLSELRVDVPLDFRASLGPEIKEAAETLEEARNAIQNVKDTYTALAHTFERASELTGERDSELIDIHHEATAALKKK